MTLVSGKRSLLRDSSRMHVCLSVQRHSSRNSKPEQETRRETFYHKKYTSYSCFIVTILKLTKIKTFFTEEIKTIYKMQFDRVETPQKSEELA